MMRIIAFFAALQSVSIKDLKMYYFKTLCLFPGSKKIANSMQRLDFTVCLQVLRILRSWKDHQGSVSPG